MNLKTKKLIAREFIVLLLTISLGVLAFLLTYPYNQFLYYKINNVETEIIEKKVLLDSLLKIYNSKTFENKDYVSRVYLTLKDIGYKDNKNRMPEDIVQDVLELFESYPDYKGAYTYETLTSDISDYKKASTLFNLLESSNDLKGAFKSTNELMSLRDSVRFKSEVLFRKILLSDTSFRHDIYLNLKNNVQGFTKSESEFEDALKNQLTQDDIEKKNRSEELEKEIKDLILEKDEIRNKVLSYGEQIYFGIGSLITLCILLFACRYIVYAVDWSLKTLKQK